ncbi:oligosaccharide flippase family protein [Curtobacterium sp. A7_M15]|uniref:oligosaccharide flippase family protein n=1 Tax=Curtobacterium sp. A7_M15 TaxID=3065241 RepID=UPI002737B264|nr:oligosaccharide flippase family protein [Curtobacterium sp. A7_M15]MDP4333950.1 oligosaccharide flippase family protein [Curtobacterium sp. A7_M15]
MARPRRNPIVVSTLGNAVAPLASLATAPILASALEPAGRGVVAAATAPLLLAVALASLGLPSALTHWVARQPAILRPAMVVAAVVSAAVGGVTTALVALLSPTLAGGDPALASLIGLAGIALVPNLLAALLQAVAAGLHAWRLVTIERVVTQSSRLLVIAVLAATGTLTVEGAITAIALSPVLGALVYLHLLRRSRAASNADASTLRAGVLLSYGGRVWLGALSGIILSRIDQSLLLPLAGAAALGLYAVAVNIADVPLIVANAVREVSFSKHSADTDHAGLARAARLTTAVVLVVAAGLTAVLPFAVPWLFGAGYAEAVPVAAVLLLGLVLGSPGSLAGVGLAAVGRPGLRSVSLAIAAVCSIATLVLLAPIAGALGAAVATLVGNVVSAGGNLVFLRRVAGMPVLPFFGLRRGDLGAVRALLPR